MKQYFKYFKILYLIFGILFIFTAVVFVSQKMKKETETERGNNSCPAERVYDYADVLTDEEEEKLREKIARAENKIQCDLIIVTINMPILDYCGYTENTDYYWKDAMTKYADDFYDQNNYGFDVARGSGALLLDNWYLAGTDESQAGSHFSTCGAVYETYSTWMIEDLLDDVYLYLDDSPYRAYAAYIDHVVGRMENAGGSIQVKIPIFFCFLTGLVPAIVFVATHLKSKEGEKTITLATYIDVADGKRVVFTEKRDDLIDKKVSSVKIQSSSSGGGGSHGSSGRGGRGGSHRSSSGTRHGGGSRRR